MRQVTTTVYYFDELTSEAQTKAIESLCDINVNYDWWDSIYDELENLGMKCNGFDLDRGSYVKQSFVDSPCEVAEKIVAEHGESCETHQDAKRFLSAWSELVKKYSDGKKIDIVADGNEDDFDAEADELVYGFLQDLQYDYLRTLRNEYEYLTSSDAIIETIKANEFEFLSNGKLA